MNKYREDLINAVLKEKELQDNLLRAEAPKNLFIFNKYVLGVSDGDNKVELAPFHKRLCKFVQDGMDRKKLVLIPRGHLKSTLVTVGYSLFRIINNPNIRILILSGTYQNAVDFVKAIQDQLTRNQRLIELFGDVAKNPVEWRNDRFTLSTSRTSVGDKEPTVMGAGIESNIVSKHFDLIILDDIVVRENTETIEQIDKVIKRYKDVIDLMETKAQMIMIGTRWTDGDVYSWIMDPENNQKQYFDIMVEKAMKWDGDLETSLKTGEGFMEALWAEKFPREELLVRYQGKGPYEFSCQYLNDPVPESEATFKREWFKYYEESDIKATQMNNFITVDPAISTEKEADFTAIVVTGVDQYGGIYIKEMIRERLSPNGIIEAVFNLAEIYHPKKIGVEEVAYQKALGYAIKEEMRHRGRYLPLVAVKPQNRSKDIRIKGLQPLYANGKVIHKRSLVNNRYLEDELLRFPRATHDDLIDALSYTLDLIVKPREKRASYENHYLY